MLNPTQINRILFIAAALLISVNAMAQERCGAEVIEKKILLQNPNYRTEFESWMKKKIEKLSKQDLSGARTNAVYTIPVVVHVIHMGEPVGLGTNIPTEQILSQMRVLNEDFQRLNADAVNTPSEFQSVAGSIDIQFVLAKQDPDGLPTNGIVRLKGTKTSYSADNDNFELKSLSYWPAEDYLNIWVTSLSGTFLGYAQFPQTTLQGTIPPYDRLTDGVVVHYRAFGSADDGAFDLLPRFNKGRTTSHEVGHFFSLIHIFGDFDGCNTTDYVSDTPVQPAKTETCPTGPITACGHQIMFQNYMDYTDDACMNLFTQGQIARIVTVLQNSPRRASLLLSDGAQDPFVLALDLEAKSIAAPFTVTCGQAITPKLVVRNRGLAIVTSTRVSLIVNGTTVETKDFTVNIPPLASQTLSFNPINLAEPSSNSISFQITQVNGGADDEFSNNITSLISQVPASVTPPFLEPFNSLPANWLVVNPDNTTTWQNVTAPKTTASNKAMYMDFYNYENTAAKDQLVSPYINITTNDALLKFDRAYAMFQSMTADQFRILISTGCSTELSDALEVYRRSGTALSTTAAQSNPFVPTGNSQWSTDAIPLGYYMGLKVRIVFEALNGNGNNLYLDNVQVTSGGSNDVAVVSMQSPGPVFCTPTTQPVVLVQNLGSTTVTRLTVLTEVNGGVNAQQTFSGFSMTPGSALPLELEALDIKQTTNTIKVTVTNPDALTDDDTPSNNSLSVIRILNSSSDVIPLRQNFDENVANWTIYSPPSSITWTGSKTNPYSNNLAFKAFSNSDLDDESWFVSPVLDLTRQTQGSLFFTRSYAKAPTGGERLRVLVSEDCGNTYDQVIFDKSGEALSEQNSSAQWTPATENDWTTEYLSINDYAGKKDIRFAFVADNDNGNNLYLDNIEFFVEDDPTPPRIEDFYSVYNSETNPYEFKIVFNLGTRQDARLVVYNSIGQVLIDSDLPATLNQTYTVNLYGQSAGVYVAQLFAGIRTATAKLFVGR